MDAEFHYYMTYLIAAKAGYEPKDALTIAYASQYVDDNDMIFEVDKDEATYFSNYISQTMNILKPKTKLMRIYPVFHFIPGEPMALGARRRDGMLHMLNCTPDSPNANAIFDAALESSAGHPSGLQRIGIAIHGFADTWAHQNFTGSFNDFNGIFMEKGLTVGHAQAGHNPDEPALVWVDDRLLEKRVDNRGRFLEAAGRILEKLMKHLDRDVSEEEVRGRKSDLLKSLDEAIGDRDQGGRHQKVRIKRYMDLARLPEYGGSALADYDSDAWLDAAVNESVQGFRDRDMEVKGYDLSRFDPLTDKFTWKDRTRYQETEWFKFQVAVKEHQKSALALLRQTSMSYVDLPDTIES